MLQREEKKVEYLELIYDLIFVYVIGRNNSLLENLENGFVTPSTFVGYVMCTLAVIQIWNYSTFYINMYGRNSIRDHVSLFLNMYLLYYIAEGTRTHWQHLQNQYHIAWALILINTGVQYAVEARNHADSPEYVQSVRKMMRILFGEALLVLAALAAFHLTGISFIWIPIVFGIVMTWMRSDEADAQRIDFPHLSERAMLYVVFSFGEMIIAIAPYFEGELTWNSVYFSTMAFLIVVGLFLCYEVLYNRVIDREMQTNGLKYMLIHIVLIFAMNNITTSLEFMRNEWVALWPKTIFLIVSFLLYFLCLFGLQKFAKPQMRVPDGMILQILGVMSVFAAVMIALRENMYLNILLSVGFVYFVFMRILWFSRKRR